MASSKMKEEALARARNCHSASNMAKVILEFQARGITDAIPGENVLTYVAWQALGRNVKKGEKGVRIETYIPIKTRFTDDDGNPVMTKKRKLSSVFHISQTVEIER